MNMTLRAFLIVPGAMLMATLGAVPARTAVAQLPPEFSAAEMIKRADTNGDGKVSLEEFIKARTARLEESFARMDSNSDGKLDDREAEAAGEQLRTMLTEGKAGFRRPEGLRAAPRTDGDKPQLPGGKSQLPGGKARLREYLQQGKALPQDTGMPKDGKVPGGAGKLDRGGLGADPGFRRPPQ